MQAPRNRDGDIAANEKTPAPVPGFRTSGPSEIFRDEESERPQKRRWLTPETVAALYGVAVGTLANWRSRDRKLIEQGKKPIGPPWGEFGRQPLYPSDLLDEWASSRINGI